MARLGGLGRHSRRRHGRADHGVRAHRGRLDGASSSASPSTSAAGASVARGRAAGGAHGRIEEHGLHVLLGYYDQTFDVMRRCYEALDRGRSDPSCPIRTWDDAVAPSNLVGVVDRHDGAWEPWVARSARSPAAPASAPAEPDASTPLAMADLVVRSLRLLIDFFASLPSSGTGASGTIAFEHLARRRRRPAPRTRRQLRGRRRARCGPARADAPAELGRAGRAPGHDVDRQP